MSEAPEGRPTGDGGATPASGGPAGETLTLEGMLERLSEIVSSLEAEDLELDRALELFEEGVRHIREAEKLLSKAELRVEELVGSGDQGRTRPFEGGDPGFGEEDT